MANTEFKTREIFENLIEAGISFTFYQSEYGRAIFIINQGWFDLVDDQRETLHELDVLLMHIDNDNGTAIVALV